MIDLGKISEETKGCVLGQTEDLLNTQFDPIECPR